MAELEDDAISEYYSLRPARFHELMRFELKKVTYLDSDSIELGIDLAAAEANSHSFLRLIFTGVSELKYVPVYWSFGFIDIVAQNELWQEKRYRVFETEQGTDLSLCCRHFRASLCSLRE